jgi:hypothetical protein
MQRDLTRRRGRWREARDRLTQIGCSSQLFEVIVVCHDNEEKISSGGYTDVLRGTAEELGTEENETVPFSHALFRRY